MRHGSLFLAAALAACSQSAPTGLSAGKALFTQAGCASCHKIGSQGSAVGPDLTLVGYRHSAEWLDLFIKDPQAWKPGTLMPNTRLAEPGRKALVGYLSGLQGQDWPKGERPWDAASLKDPVARGRVIYARAGCVGCHGSEGTGGFPNRHAKGGMIPALNKAAEGFSKTELIAKIRKGVASPQSADPAGPAPMIRMPSWAEKLDDAELEAVASYLLTLSPSKTEKTDW